MKIKYMQKRRTQKRCHIPLIISFVRGIKCLYSGTNDNSKRRSIGRYTTPMIEESGGKCGGKLKQRVLEEKL